MSSQNSKSSDQYKLVLNLTDKVNTQRSNKRVALPDLSTYHTWNNVKKFCGKNKFKISDTNWDEEFELPDRFQILYQTIPITSSRSMKHLLISHKFKCMSIKFETELHSIF